MDVVIPGNAKAVGQPLRRWLWVLPLLIGIAALAIPTLAGIAQVSWSSEQGAHGPIVLAIAIWLLARVAPVMAEHASPGRAAIGWPLLVLSLTGYLIAHLVGSITIESGMLYLTLVAALYLFVGARAMQLCWFPIVYLLFVLPPPGSVVAGATQPLRLGLSELAVDLLGLLGYPVARAGLTIYISQYVLEVKAACGGLNSMISLTAIGLFYAYIRHNSNARYIAVLFIVIIAMAILANYVRVLILILITYYMGDRAAQGFLHEFAGLTMFTVAIGGIMIFDQFGSPLRRALARPTS